MRLFVQREEGHFKKFGMLYQKLRRTYGAPGRIMGNRCWFHLFFTDILTLQNDMDCLVD